MKAQYLGHVVFYVKHLELQTTSQRDTSHHQRRQESRHEATSVCGWGRQFGGQTGRPVSGPAGFPD